ncbi:TPA: GNAT family N-acetyltransferase [Vibrio harveyi]|nr:GNAT family N-acetyltransferase [Vibrio harveyi]
MELATGFNNTKFVFSPVCVNYASEFFESISSREFPSSLPLAEIKTLTQAKAWCLDMVSGWESGKCYVWTCRRSSDSAIVGQVTLIPKENCLALAYWVVPSLWGQGIATEMCKSLLVHIQRTGYRGNVWAGVHSWNARSSSVLKKLGFKEIESSVEGAEYLLEIVC